VIAFGDAVIDDDDGGDDCDCVVVMPLSSASQKELYCFWTIK
jgi:hypothetical protein